MSVFDIPSCAVPLTLVSVGINVDHPEPPDSQQAIVEHGAGTGGYVNVRSFRDRGAVAVGASCITTLRPPGLQTCELMNYTRRNTCIQLPHFGIFWHLRTRFALPYESMEHLTPTRNGLSGRNVFAAASSPSSSDPTQRGQRPEEMRCQSRSSPTSYL